MSTCRAKAKKLKKLNRFWNLRSTTMPKNWLEKKPGKKLSQTIKKSNYY